MVTITSNLRSTNSITEFVTASDELASIKLREKIILSEMKRLTPEVLEQIGERREVRVNRQVRILTPRIVESISRACDEDELVEFCLNNGLPDAVKTRSAQTVYPATFVKLVRENAIPETMIERKVETQITVV